MNPKKMPPPSPQKSKTDEDDCSALTTKKSHNVQAQEFHGDQHHVVLEHAAGDTISVVDRGDNETKELFVALRARDNNARIQPSATTCHRTNTTDKPQSIQQQQQELAKDSYYGWDLEKGVFAHRDPCFPQAMIQWSISPEDIPNSLARMQQCFQHLSIQAHFEDRPIFVQLRTMENIKLSVQFLLEEEKNGGTVGVVIQRLGGGHGDDLDASRYMHQILAATKGPQVKPPLPSAVQIHKFESFLDSFEKMVVARTSVPRSQEDGLDPSNGPWVAPIVSSSFSMMESFTSMLQNVHRSMTCKSLDQRQQGLETLKVLTDLEQTLSQTAIATSLVVIEGKSPTTVCEKECREIHQVLARIIMKRDFQGDDTNMYSDIGDVDIPSFSSMVPSNSTENTTGRSRYYDQYMNNIVFIALSVQSNALEALHTFKDNEALDDSHMPSYDFASTITSLCTSCSEQLHEETPAAAEGLVATLVRVVGEAMQMLPEATLACKSLRYLIEGNSNILLMFRNNTNSRRCVNLAVHIGALHTQLQIEATKLQSFL